MTYLAKNIREGKKLSVLLGELAELGQPLPTKIYIQTFDHGRDVNGNGTGHYNCYIDLSDRYLDIVSSGGRREQVGYSGANGAALYALNKLGYNVDTSKRGSYDTIDHDGLACYPLILEGVQ